MKKDWTYKKLIDVCGIQYGYPFDSKCFTEDNTYPALIRIRDVVRGYTETFYKGDVPEEYYVQKGEYLIGMDGEFNIAPWRSEKALLNQRVCKIFSITSNVDIQFVYYSLQRQLKQIEDETPFVTVKHLSAKRLNQIELPIPPLSIQRSIVAELDLLHSVISKKKEQLRELDNLAQSLFYQMFGDPITNPMGWEIKKLGEVVDFYNGKAHEQEIDELGKFILINSKFIATNASVYKRTAKQLFPLLKEDIVMVMSDVPHGRALAKCYIIKDNDKYSLNQRICAFRNHKQNTTFLYYVINRNSYFIAFDNGNSQTNLRKDDILDCPIILPPLSLQQSFAAKVSAIEAQKQAITLSIKETEALLAQRMDTYFS